jgi:hypothetical protein
MLEKIIYLQQACKSNFYTPDAKTKNYERKI